MAAKKINLTKEERDILWDLIEYHLADSDGDSEDFLRALQSKLDPTTEFLSFDNLKGGQE